MRQLFSVAPSYMCASHITPFPLPLESVFFLPQLAWVNKYPTRYPHTRKRRRIWISWVIRSPRAASAITLPRVPVDENTRSPSSKAVKR